MKFKDLLDDPCFVVPLLIVIGAIVMISFGCIGGILLGKVGVAIGMILSLFVVGYLTQLILGE